VPAHAFVAGNPARRKGWVCACGERLDPHLRCPADGTAYAMVSDVDGLRPT